MELPNAGWSSQKINFDLNVQALNTVPLIVAVIKRLSIPKGKVKVGSSFSKELEILCGVPQGSILGPLLFNVDIYDLFFIDMSLDVTNYADDTTPYECAPYYDKLKENLEFTIYKIFHWFKNNNFKANASECLFFFLG